ncbi:cytochrome c oxidase subunit II [Rhodoligotrophos defluvii]|uniref:cytochrome c oxidase subunit II n=1 Tax=Rhodoligotrophos defluvii TaxID=2561934 RepID=UPI0010C94F0D|nr:c-type cytochrome [Rhodoligotrophos defluvii]
MDGGSPVPNSVMSGGPNRKRARVSETPPLRGNSGIVLFCGFVILLLQGCSQIQSSLEPASRTTALIADFWWGMLLVGMVILAGVLLLLFVGLRRGGPRGERPLSTRGAFLLVLTGGVVTPLAVILAMVVVGVLIGKEIAKRPESGPIVEVVGRLWWWELRYLDEEGDLIATTANEMHVPVGRPVRLRLISDNVIHSFWVPRLQGKTDLIPGQVNESWIEAEKAGVYRGQCSEYCGTQHALMSFLVVAEPPEVFERWLSRQAEPATEPESEAQARGRQVFVEQGCAACHTIRGVSEVGEIGPDLTHLAGRRMLAAAAIPNTRGHLGGWISDPQHVKPGNKMPSTVMEPNELQALLVYLGSLE